MSDSSCQTVTNEEFWVDVRFTVRAYGSGDAADYVHQFIPDVELDHPVQSWAIARSKEKSFSEPYLSSHTTKNEVKD